MDPHAAEDLVQAALEDALVRWKRVCAADHPDLYVQRVLLHRYLAGRRRRSSTEVVLAQTPETADRDHRDAIAARSTLSRTLRGLRTAAETVGGPQ